MTNLTSSISLVGEQQKPTAAAIQAGLVAGNTFYIGEPRATSAPPLGAEASFAAMVDVVMVVVVLLAAWAWASIHPSIATTAASCRLQPTCTTTATSCC